MSSPVELSDLPVATIADNADVTLLRKGLTDYQCAVSLIRNIDIASLTPLSSAVASDVLMIQRASSNYSIRFDQIGVVKGTKTWFWQASAPLGWSIVPNTGDRLLAVADGSTNYDTGAGGTQKGTWQQGDVDGIPGNGLTIQQIPDHTHQYYFGETQSNSNANFAHGAVTSTGRQATTSGINQKTNPGACAPHNHGSVWRPLANVGIICNKDG